MCMFNKESKLLKIKNDYINYFKITCKNSHLNIARYLFNKSVLLTEEVSLISFNDDNGNDDNNEIMKSKLENMNSWIYLNKKNIYI